MKTNEFWCKIRRESWSSPIANCLSTRTIKLKLQFSTEHSHRGAIRLFGEQSYVRMSCIGERPNHFAGLGWLAKIKRKLKRKNRRESGPGERSNFLPPKLSTPVDSLVFSSGFRDDNPARNINVFNYFLPNRRDMVYTLAYLEPIALALKGKKERSYRMDEDRHCWCCRSAGREATERELRSIIHSGPFFYYFIIIILQVS
jgi:hypothetical protein